MIIKQKMNIDDLEFNIVLTKMDYSSGEEKNQIEVYNLFAMSRVKQSVARWVLMSPEERKKHDFLPWCFSDVWGRCEYEFIVCPWPFNEDEKVVDNGRKVDTYKMYVKPNAKLLEDLVNRVSKTSAQRYLREERKKYRR